MTISHVANEIGDPIVALITTMEMQLAEIQKDLTNVKEVLVKADETITKVAAEVMPTINGLLESPMLKMLTGGKKK